MTTNHERIKQLGIKELANLLSCSCCIWHSYKKCVDNENIYCEDGKLEWLMRDTSDTEQLVISTQQHEEVDRYKQLIKAIKCTCESQNLKADNTASEILAMIERVQNG